MGEKTVTTMKIKVDLKCEKSKKKIKKVLCKIPQIENQVYDEKNNTVTITVVCCSPEKVKKKILHAAGCIIIEIEIVKPSTEQNQKREEPPPKHKPPPPCDCCVLYPRGPCYPGHGWPLPPCYCSCHGCYGRPVCNCWGSGCRMCYMICEENPTACTIM